MIDAIQARLGSDKKLMFVVPYGSQHYNLSNEYSDEDWYGFYAPQIHGEVPEMFYVQPKQSDDVVVFSYARFVTGVKRLEARYVEILYNSSEISTHSLKDTTKELIIALFSLAPNIVCMNLPMLFDRRKAECLEHLEWYYTTEEANLSYRVKYLTHAFRSLDILERFYKTGFLDYKYALEYNENDAARHLILLLKAGELSEEYFIELINKKLVSIEQIRAAYTSADQQMINIVDRLLLEIALEEGIQWTLTKTLGN